MLCTQGYKYKEVNMYKKASRFNTRTSFHNSSHNMENEKRLNEIKRNLFECPC